MATVKMMQGDSYPVFVDLKISGPPVQIITPAMVEEVEICVGDSLRKLYSSGDVGFDETEKQWFFIPSQQETLDLEPESYEVQARLKFPNGNYSPTKGISVGRIEILDANSTEVI